jgi:hypothetical protein
MVKRIHELMITKTIECKMWYEQTTPTIEMPIKPEKIAFDLGVSFKYLNKKPMGIEISKRIK